MRKILLLALLLAAASAAAWLADNAGEFSIHWLGWQIEGSMALLLVAFVLLSCLVWLVLHLLNSLLNLPAELRLEHRYQRGEKGLTHLTQAMLASSENDARAMQKHLAKAQAFLPDSPLPKLLQLQLAAKKHDTALAQQHLAQLQQYDATKGLALRGMAEQARASGNMQEALVQVESLLKTAPHLASTQKLAVDVFAHHRRWQEAQKQLQLAKQQKHLTTSEYRRANAAILYQQALQMLEDTNREGALKMLSQASNEDPSLQPACLKYAEMLRQIGKHNTATRILNRSWKYAPHPLTASAFMEPYADLPTAKRMKKAQELAKLNPDAMESHILLAETAIQCGDWELARNTVKIAMSRQTTVSLCRLMARVCREGFADEAEERRWLDKAVTALPDSSWQCTHCHATPIEWQTGCESCHQFASIYWQPQGYLSA